VWITSMIHYIRIQAILFIQFVRMLLLAKATEKSPQSNLRVFSCPHPHNVTPSHYPYPHGLDSKPQSKARR
jgi:hypothetical protein